MNPANMTEHQDRIAEFMKLAGQALLPSEAIRKLGAWLILEEALETIDALGFCAEVVIKDDGSQQMKSPILVAHDRGPNLTSIADGCADTSVVTIGTLLACGIADKPLLEEVDRSNLAKFELPKCPTEGAILDGSNDNGEGGTYPANLVMQREMKTPHCHHCRGILSNKLVSNMIDRNVGLPCPNCMQLLNLISVVYA